MSRINNLIHELCPDGVPSLPLEEVIELKFGTRITKRESSGHIYAVYGGGGESFRTDSYNREDDYVISRFAMSAECVRRVAGRFWLLDSGFTFEVRDHRVHKDYVAQWLFNNQPTIYATSSQGAQKNLKVAQFRKLRIPVPPLEVQDEIVKILDTFSALTAELEAELEARRAQYEYYRATLLSSEELLDSGWTPLGELASFKYGQTAKAADRGDVRFIRITDISEQGKLRPSGAKYLPATEVNHVYQVERGDVLIARTGASFGKSVLISGETGSYASFLIRLRFNEEKVLPQYFWHFAQSSLYWDQAERLVSRGGQPQFNANVLKTLRMPVPALHTQRKVAMLLNSFDALVNDLTSGLPAEIEARRKQYEYYRDGLLAFEEAAG